MVNKSLIYQNASSLNGPIEQLIESIVTCVNEYSEQPEDCEESNDMYGTLPVPTPVSCVLQCLKNEYCRSPTTLARMDKPLSTCSVEQRLFLGISAGIIAEVLKKYKSSQSS